MRSAEDHETIWLAPVCHEGQGDGRMWAHDNPFNGCEEDGALCKEDHQPVQYVRADIAERREREAREAALEDACCELCALCADSHNPDGACGPATDSVEGWYHELNDHELSECYASEIRALARPPAGEQREGGNEG